MIATSLAYALLLVIAVLFGLGHAFPPLTSICQIADLALLGLWIFDFFLTKRVSVTAARDIADRLSIGQSNLVELRVMNESNQKLHCLAKDDCPELFEKDVQEFDFEIAPGSVSTLQYNVVPRVRGLYQFKNINIRWRSRLGLFWQQKKVKAEQHIKVYSDLKTLHELSVKLSRSTALGELHQRRRGQGTEFASLREYSVDDDNKQIDWKATARRDRPVVRTYEVQQEQRLIVLIDAGRMMTSNLEGLSRFDHALNAGLCLALTGLSHNDQVGFGVFADKPLLYLPPKRGRGYFKKILDGSFAVEPRMIEPDYGGMLAHFASMQKGRSMIVVLTDLTDPTGSQTLLAGLAGLAPRHLPFCVTLKDRQVGAIANTVDTNLDTMHAGPLREPKLKEMETIYRRAIAIDLLNQRQLALSVLQRRGCLILDCPPQDLNTRIVDAYLDAKARNRL